MLTRLYIENFRAFKRESIELSKINLFFGPNNGGKSSILSAINLFSQNVQSTYSDSEVLLSGKFEDLGAYYDVVNGNDESKNVKIGIEASVAITRRSFVQGARGGRLLRTREEQRRGYSQITIGYSKSRHEVRLLETETIVPEDGLVLRTKRNRLGKHVVQSMEGLAGLGESKLNQMIFARNLLLSVYPLRIPLGSGDYYDRLRRLQDYLRGLRENLNEVEFVGPFRANPQRLYVLTGESPSSVGRHGERALEILRNDEKRKGKAKKNLLREVTNWMANAEIASSIYIQSFTDRYFEVIVRNFYTNEEENLADVGFGCGQVIPILVAGFHVRQGGVLIAEEPEIHLHPKAQAELGSLVHILYRRGIQLFIETHSEHLLVRLQSHVARGEIDPEDVHVFYVDPAGKKRAKEITRIPLGKDGYFQKKWPKGFFPERLQEAERLAGIST
jgi:predicted ATPase